MQRDNWLSFLRPFGRKLWFTTVAWLITSFLVFVLLSCLKKEERRTFILQDVLLLTMGTFLGRGKEFFLMLMPIG